MADQTIKVNRNELQTVFKNPRLVRAIEDLINSTQVLLPDQVQTLSIAIREASLDAGSAQASASAAETIALRIGEVLQRIDVAPLREVHVAARDDPSGRLEALEARVTALASEVDGIKQGLTS